MHAGAGGAKARPSPPPFAAPFKRVSEACGRPERGRFSPIPSLARAIMNPEFSPYCCGFFVGSKTFPVRNLFRVRQLNISKYSPGELQTFHESRFYSVAQPGTRG